MAVSLLRLTDGGCSPEFEPGDIDAVAAMLEAMYGAPTVTRYPTLSLYFSEFAAAASFG